ncbi:MAG: response regulator transcription factor, partial [Butyrivibrio sp.]|nr:response regulator transcription factor [Butyrivibrio sp.]
SDVPIIMLTAKGDDMDKILGLEYGADDYITKPFNILEVKARMKAIMRRAKKGNDDKSVISYGDLKLNEEYRRVFVGNREIKVTSREYELLELLASNPGKVYSRDELLTLIWGNDYPGDVRTVDVHIRRLREKLESTPSEPRYVRTKWGSGYYFQP